MGAAPQKPPQEAARKLVPAPALAAAAGSTLLHVLLAGTLLMLAAQPQKKAPDAVRVKIITEVKKKPPPPPPAPVEERPEPPKPKSKKPPEKKRSSERKPTEKPPAKPPPPVQGLSPSALSPDGKGIAAPVGNTLMAPDEGKRLQAAEVKPLSDEDLSADAALIRASVRTPVYTDAALDAELEGTYTVEVFVDGAGAVTDAQLPKKIGYGMDEKVLAAARQARFNPRKDKVGRPIPGWTELKFRLEIPH